MRATQNMAEAILKDVEKIETTMPDIKVRLEQNVMDLLDTTDIISLEDIQSVSKCFDDVLGLLQNHDGTLLSFIRSMVKSGTVPTDLQDAVKGARLRVQDMSGEIAWSRERLVSQVDIHNAGLGCFTFLSVVRDHGKAPCPVMDGPSPGEVSGPKTDGSNPLVADDASTPVSDDISTPMQDDVSNAVSEDA